jgi:hypothetical protein
MGSKSDKDTKSAVRRRVEKHLKKLLIPGVMGIGACKSTEPPVVCDPMPAPADAAAPPTETTTPPAEQKDATPPPVVCDPMPAPMPTPKKK